MDFQVSDTQPFQTASHTTGWGLSRKPVILSLQQSGCAQSGHWESSVTVAKRVQKVECSAVVFLSPKTARLCKRLLSATLGSMHGSAQFLQALWTLLAITSSLEQPLHGFYNTSLGFTQPCWEPLPSLLLVSSSSKFWAQAISLPTSLPSHLICLHGLKANKWWFKI